MGLALLVYLGGVLTIVSPCILPVLPFVFARSEQGFLRNGLPLLLGMAVSFAAIATLAAVGGAWAINLNTYGRDGALVLLTLFALTLLSRRLADAFARPFVALGNRLSQGAPGEGGALRSALLGVATGLLWAPCAGPILGLIFTGAAISGPSVHTTFLLLAYAAGAASSLAVALLAGGRVFTWLRRSLGAGEWVRRALGVAVLAGVVAIVLGWDTTVLTGLSTAGTTHLEQSLIDTLHPPASPGGAMAMSGANGAMSNSAMAMSAGGGNAMMMSGGQPRGLPVEGEFPGFAGGTEWLNSVALSDASLRGKVVLVDFWTYSCINCLRALPYVKSWYDKYKDHGLVVVGVHAPEFAFEKDPANVRRAVRDLGVTYPVVLDNNLAIWQAFNNQYWPAHYFIDAQGRIRAHHFGEGEYDQSEATLRQLLMESGQTDLPPAASAAAGEGAQAPPDEAHDQSPETYVGYARAEHFVSPGGVSQDAAHDYGAPASYRLNQWALTGTWNVGPEQGVLQAAHGKIVFRFLARDLHLVLGPSSDGKPVRFRVSIDGAAPGANHGVDTDAAGNGTVLEQRLYQLVRQTGEVREHTFTIEFLDPGVEAYSFTFG